MPFHIKKNTPTKARTLGAAGKGQRPAATSRVPQKVKTAAIGRQTIKRIAKSQKILARR